MKKTSFENKTIRELTTYSRTMDAFLKPATAQKPVVAPIDDSKPSPLTAEARAAWAEIAKPVCE